MIDLDIVRPGSTIRIPFGSYDGGTGASITASAFVAADIQIYKDGGVTQRASASGITATVDFSGEIGIHTLFIDLSDNTTANFYEAGSEYFVVVGPITIDGQTVRFPTARFIIGYKDAILNTTIATLASQTSFTLEDGSLLANVYRGCTILVHQLDDEFDVAIGYISAYAVTTKTITLSVDPDGHVMVAGDHVAIFMPANVEAWRRELVAVPTVGGVPEVDLTHIGGVAQSAIDLKDFADEGYDPATNKVQGVVLVDTSAVNSDMVAEAPTVVAIRTEMDSNSVDLNSLISLVTAARMSELDDAGGKLVAIVDLIKTAVDLIKTEADKIALVDAGAGVAGSVIEEVENRATPTQVQSELGTYDALVPADLPTNFSSMGIEADGDVHADIKEWLGVAPGALIGGAGGRVDSSVGAMAANVLNAAAINAAAFTSGKFAAGAIDANALATDAAQKIRDQILPVTNVALSNIPFIFVAASDHVTPVTGATGVSGERSIDGGAYVGVSGTITEVSDGSYQFDALAADMNGGIITFKFSATGGTPGAADDRFVTIVTNIGV